MSTKPVISTGKPLNSTPNGEHYAFTARQYAIFLTDLGDLLQAEHLLQDAIKTALSDDALPELKAVLCGVWMKKLVAPYDLALLDTLKNTLWEVLQHYQKQGRKVEEALLLVDAAQVANYSESFAEALGYIGRAVDILRNEEMPELLAQAQYRAVFCSTLGLKRTTHSFFGEPWKVFRKRSRSFRGKKPPMFLPISTNTWA
jgi:tetratricopeptide (TPR) repeat protein